MSAGGEGGMGAGGSGGAPGAGGNGGGGDGGGGSGGAPGAGAGGSGGTAGAGGAGAGDGGGGANGAGGGGAGGSSGGSGGEGGGSGAAGSGAGGAGGSGAGPGGGGEGGGNGAGGEGPSASSTPRSAPAAEASPPAPIVNAEGQPGLIAVADVINSKAEPIQNLANLDLNDPFSMDNVQTVAGAIQGIQDVMDVGGMVSELIDTGFATLTAPIAAMFPALPAMTLGALHMGIPHTHTHPPSLVPPAPPIPLPSIGTTLLPGCINVFIGGAPAARCGDVGLAVTCGSLGPPFEIASGSSNVFIGGRRAARFGDLTKHCQPSTEATSMPSLKSAALDIAADGLLSGLADGSVTSGLYAAAQTAAEMGAMAIKAMVGKDPGVPMLPGALVGPPLSSVNIGGFPCPGIGEFATQKLGGLLKKIGKHKKKGGKGAQGDTPPRKKHGDEGDSSAKQHQNNDPVCNGTHPVYLVTGENFDRFVDYAPGGLFEWRRHYTTARYNRDSPLGHGWRHYYQRTLDRRLHRAKFTNWDGLVTEFGRFELGEDTTRADGYVLRRLGRGHFRLSRRGEPHLEFAGGEFDDRLPLTRVVAEHASLALEYDRLGRLHALVETPEKIEEPRRRFELRYDAQSHITHVLEVDPDAPYAADGSGRPGVARVACTYSAQRDLTLVEDSLGGRWGYRYDAFHRLTQQSDARGYRYDYGYDASGRCISASGQDGLWWAKIAYFPERRFTRYTEGDDATWEYHYDADGNTTKIVDPYGGVRQRRLDEAGRMAVEVDSGGREMHWLYDDDGCHYGRVDRFGHLFPPVAALPVLPNPFRQEPASHSLGYLAGSRLPADTAAIAGIDPAVLVALPPEIAHAARSAFRLSRPSTAGEPVAAAVDVRRDRMGRVVSETDARGRTRSWQYDATGNLIGETDADGQTRRWEIASWNLVGRRIDPLGNPTAYEYSKLEQVTAIVDPLGNRSEYAYDLKERLVGVQRHGRLHEEYVYDAGDHFIEKRDADGAVLFTNTIHDNHFVEQRTLASGGWHKYDYDARGRVIEASTDRHVVRRTFDATGACLEELRDGRGVVHELTERGRASLILGRFRQLDEAQHQAISLVDARGGATRIDHREAGLLTRQCSNGTIELSQYDDAGRLETSLRYRPSYLGRSSRDSIIRYTYSPAGDLTMVSDSERGATRYEVDAAHRLRAEITPSARVLAYPLDAAGNLRERPGTGPIDVATGNRLASSPHESFDHDARQRIARRQQRADGSVVEYAYDSFDMLVRIRRTEAQVPSLERLLRSLETRQPAPEPACRCERWEAAYDGLGRRLWSRWTDLAGAEQRREFYWDGDRLAAEILPTGTLRVYQYASHDAACPLHFTDYASEHAPVESGKTYHVFYNATGMPLCIEDADGNQVWYVERADPYGLLTLRAEPAGGSAKPRAALEYNLRWPGHYFDPETGLHYNRYRYYDPQLGRYLQPDPIGHEGSPVNLYAYCPNPLVQVDVFGLHPDDTPGSEGSKETGGKKDGREGADNPNSDSKRQSKEEWGKAFGVNPETGKANDGVTPDRQAKLDERRERYEKKVAKENAERREAGEPERDAMADKEWRESAFRANTNRDESNPREQAAMKAVGAEGNNGAEPKTHEYKEYHDADGRPVRDEGGAVIQPKDGEAPPKEALDENGEPRVRTHNTRPDGVRQNPDGTMDVVEHKHMSGKETKLSDSSQMRAEREMAEKNGGKHEVVMTSDHGMNEDGKPIVEPSQPLGQKSKVSHVDENGNVTHVWDPNSNSWQDP